MWWLRFFLISKKKKVLCREKKITVSINCSLRLPIVCDASRVWAVTTGQSVGFAFSACVCASTVLRKRKKFSMFYNVALIPSNWGLRRPKHSEIIKACFLEFLHLQNILQVYFPKWFPKNRTKKKRIKSLNRIVPTQCIHIQVFFFFFFFESKIFMLL